MKDDKVLFSVASLEVRLCLNDETGRRRRIRSLSLSLSTFSAKLANYAKHRLLLSIRVSRLLSLAISMNLANERPTKGMPASQPVPGSHIVSAVLLREDFGIVFGRSQQQQQRDLPLVTHYLPTCLLISASLGRRSLGVQCSERPAITNNYLAAFNTHRATLCECTLLCELPLLPHQRPPIDITNITSIACDTSLCKSHTDAERPQPDLPHHLLLAIYSR